MHRSPASPLTRPLADAVTQGRGNGFSVASLFASGEQGAIYDISDLSTLFSDAAGTTPAVVDGVVGKVADKSGRGNHATQATTAAKPILRSSGGLYWLEFDGVDDGLTATFGAITSGLSILAGIEWAAAGSSQMVAGVTAANWGRGMLYVRTTSPRYGFNSFNDSTSGAVTNFTVAAAEKAVISGVGTASGTQNNYRNGVAGTGNSAGVTALASQAWGIGGGNASFSRFTGKLFVLAVVGAAVSDPQRMNMARFSANKSGVTLP